MMLITSLRWQLQWRVFSASNALAASVFTVDGALRRRARDLTLLGRGIALGQSLESAANAPKLFFYGIVVIGNPAGTELGDIFMLKTLGAAVILAVLFVYLGFGAISPCGILRESVRQQDTLAAALPDSIVDLALIASYGALSPGRCLAILFKGQEKLVSLAPANPRPRIQQQTPSAPLTGDDAIRAAAKEASAAIIDCRDKRLRGELKTFVASVQCSNPRIVQAYSTALYRYMDLINLFAAKRLEIARKMDRHELSEAEGQLENAKLTTAMAEAERRRDNSAR